MYEYLRFPAGRKVSPVFEYGHFVCGCCKRELSITYEHIGRLEDRSQLKCAFCKAPLMLDDGDLKRLSVLIKRLVVRGKCVFIIGGGWFTAGLAVMPDDRVLGKIMLLSFSIVMFVVARVESQRPPLHVVLKPVVPEVKKRYRRQWRLEQ